MEQIKFGLVCERDGTSMRGLGVETVIRKS